MIEAQDLSKAQSWKLPSDQYSNRASSLTPTNVAFLDKIGAWDCLDQSRVQPYDEMQVWDAANDSSLQFDWRAEGRKYNAPPRTVATMVENANLTKGLLKRISNLGADDCLLTSTSVSSIENGQDDSDGHNLSTWPILSLSSSSATATSTSGKSSLAARLLIGADGFNSPVRTFAGISSHGWDYNRHGVVATLKLEPREPTHFTDPNSLDSFFTDEDTTPLSNHATAYQRFIPSLGGPIAILPLPDNHASLVWSTTPQVAAYLKTLSPESFAATVNAALTLSQADIKYLTTLETKDPKFHSSELTWRLKHTPQTTPVTPPQVISVQPGTIASFPLRMRHTTSFTAPHIALAGDAAHTIHPLAGQGLNLGLGDVSSLASTIEYAVSHGMELGDPMTLERYSRDRYGVGLKMAGTTDGLNWLYQIGAEGGIIGDGLLGSIAGRVRGLGMKVVDSLPGLKERIMRNAE